jgi:hypothetical protein
VGPNARKTVGGRRALVTLGDHGVVQVVAGIPRGALGFYDEEFKRSAVVTVRASNGKVDFHVCRFEDLRIPAPDVARRWFLRSCPRAFLDCGWKLRRTEDLERRVAKANYGVVRIMAPGSGGILGYYDDDEAGQAIVYPGEPLVADYLVVPRGQLRMPSAPAVRRWLRQLGTLDEVAVWLRDHEVPRDFVRRSPHARRARFRLIRGGAGDGSKEE